MNSTPTLAAAPAKKRTRKSRRTADSKTTAVVFGRKSLSPGDAPVLRSRKLLTPADFNTFFNMISVQMAFEMSEHGLKECRCANYQLPDGHQFIFELSPEMSLEITIHEKEDPK